MKFRWKKCTNVCQKKIGLYAAVEAQKFSHGGVSYIARLFGCARDTVLQGIKELNSEETLPIGRNRKVGGGRTSILKKEPDIHEVFLRILKDHTAGDPTDEKVKWTNLTRAEISGLLAKHNFKVSRNIIHKLLKNHGYVKRKALKKSLLEDM